jgi:hypothetical protein
LGGTKLALSRPASARLAQPRRVGHVRLAAGDLFDVARGDQQQLEVVLEDRPHRLPIDAGRLHRDLRDTVRRKPVAQRQQPRDRGRELREVHLTLAAGRRRAHASGHLRLVDIKRTRALDDRLHQTSQNVIDKIAVRGPLRTGESDRRARGNNRGCPDRRGTSSAIPMG